MPNTYHQIFVQIIFAVRNRKRLIDQSWEEDLHKYITGIIQQKNQTLIAINGVEDHIHILINMKPTCCLSDLVREIKKSSTKYINENKYSQEAFHWQEGFGVFSYNARQVEMIKNYIFRQKEHHRQKSFKSEYVKLLEEFEVDYKEEYLFDWIKEA
ncbi:MAG: IS200/IS605 family transposase [Flavobacteriia bacterium]|jgi:putative transposase